MSEFPEYLARKIFQTAIRDSECGALLDCLFSGGSVTYDPIEDRNVMINEDQIAGLFPQED